MRTSQEVADELIDKFYKEIGFYPQAKQVSIITVEEIIGTIDNIINLNINCKNSTMIIRNFWSDVLSILKQ